MPQSYLRRFTINGEKSLIWVFDKRRSKFKKRKSTVNKICSEDYSYFQQDSEGGFDHIKFEDCLSEIEKIGNDIIIKITNSFSLPFAAISEKERAGFGFYMSLMLTRGPSFRNGINELYGQMASTTLSHIYKKGNFPEIPYALNKMIIEKGIENVIKTEVYSSVSLEGVIEVARQISLKSIEKNWSFLIAPPDHEFITSDTPVSFSSCSGLEENLGPGHPDAKITFPISKKICLVIFGSRKEKDMSFITCKPEDVRSINQAVANSANEFVFCSEKFNWIHNIITNKMGQKLVTTPNKNRFSIINNPFKPKTNNAIKRN